MKNLYKALAGFQQEVPVILKETKGYGYKYAPLPAILEVINPLLKKHGLGFYQRIEGSNLETVLFHVETGETINSNIPFIEGMKLKGMNDIQILGSQITYLRRYSLSSMLGLVTDEDNDAAGEQVKKPKLEGEKLEKARMSLAKGDVTVEQIAKHYDIEGVDFKLEELL